jgi:ribosomal protein L12E/L44/L45/RPP1/RPP2
VQITLTKEVTEFLGKRLEPFGQSEDSIRWKRDFDVDLADLTQAKTKQLRELLLDAGRLKGAPNRVADIDRWLAILGGEKVRCKKLKDFAPMLKQYLKTAPKHWLYSLRDESKIYQPHFISNISYTPPKRTEWETLPGYVTVAIHWEELGKVQKAALTFHAEDAEDMTVGRALAESGYSVETPEMLAQYEANRRRYAEIHDKVGRQFLASGTGEQEEEEKDFWWRRHTKIRLDREGVPSRVVVDLLHEGDEERGQKKDHRPSAQFWTRDGCDFEGKEEDDDTDIKPGDEDDDDPAETEVAEIPLHPALMCFDLKRHTRLKIYVDQLADYVYQTDLGRKLILPAEVTDLVTMLVGHRGGFKDIIGNKGGGAIILCAGPPGTGKTLTSEIYSEAMERPLYSVQCSQLGTDPDALETELLKVFARAQRWGAILLLDEADVYVASRGRDLTQNAIVGVFLRVLEYYGGVLFLTTNRADLVDDAVASRCLARIDYRVPTPPDQARIWRTLADTAGVDLGDAEIKKIVKEFPELSGRDVKNLLKLASMVAAAKKTPVDAKMVGFVKQFKPTVDETRRENE